MNRLVAKVKSWVLVRPVAEKPPANFFTMYGLAGSLLERMERDSQWSLRLPNGTVERKIVMSNTSSPWGHGDDRVEKVGLVYKPDNGSKSLVSAFPVRLHAQCAFIANGDGPEYSDLVYPEVVSFPGRRGAETFIADAEDFLALQRRVRIELE